MHSFLRLALYCALSSISIAGVTKQTTVTVNNPSTSLHILRNTRSVQTTSNEWKVTFASQEGYDLQVSLTNEWGFDPINPSTLTLTLNGTNYNHAEGDLLLVFSVSNSQYFGVVIRNEISSQLYKVYPKSYSSPLSQANVPHMIGLSSPDRWDRITKNDSWYNTVPIYKNPTGSSTPWPIQLTVLNDPITNTVRYSQNEVLTNTELYSATYLSSFAPNDGLDLYIMSDGVGESFGIYDMHINYQIETIRTNNPSAGPTKTPSIAPSNTPSIPPTTPAPSVSPVTQSPTIYPTISPTTGSPTAHPTTTRPTLDPTLRPTKRPTKSPVTSAPVTAIPTQDPTVVIQSDMPTQPPTSHPSDGPTVSNIITLDVQTETTSTNHIDLDGTTVIMADSNEIDDFIVVRATHNDIAVVSVLAACIGSVFCVFTLVLLCCCVKSQSGRHTKAAKPHRIKNSFQYHVPPVNPFSMPSNTNMIQIIYPMENANEPTASTTLGSLPTLDEEEKEGELLTVNGMHVDMNDLMKYDTSSMPSNTSKRRPGDGSSANNVVHDVNVHTIIDYNQMHRYLNDDEMSSSSHENNLAEMKQNLADEVTKIKTRLQNASESESAM